MIIYSLADDGREEDRGDVGSYLDRKLELDSANLKQADHVGGCLEGTQKAVLAEVETWLAPKNFCDSNLSRTDRRNVLWISGAPGAGKSTLASTIISELLNHKCATLFIDRYQTANPGRIWQTIARQRAECDRRVKLDLLEFLLGDVYHASIEDQFCRLIREPLKRNFPDGPTSSRRIVVVIDISGERDPDDQKEWDAFWDMIVKWSKELPTTCKLVIASRVEADVEKALKGVSYRLALDIGDDVSDESRDDIRRYVEAGFKSVKMGDSWSDQDSITKLTEYAAGHFAWAAAVMDFVTEESADHISRLETVFGNMAKAGQLEDDPIGQLYAQLLYQSVLRKDLQKHISANLVLASLVLLREDLPKKALLALLAPEGLHSRSLSTIETAIDSLRSIIVTREPGDVLRVCHRSFSDFLLDEEWVHASLRSEYSWLDDSTLNTMFSHARQHTLLAEGCLHLMNNYLEIYTGQLHLQNPTDIQAALAYACVHWVDHLRLGVVRVMDDTSDDMDNNSDDMHDSHGSDDTHGISDDTDSYSDDTDSNSDALDGIVIDLSPLLKMFLQENALRWLEVSRSFRQDFDVGNSLLKVAEYVKVRR